MDATDVLKPPGGKTAGLFYLLFILGVYHMDTAVST